MKKIYFTLLFVCSICCQPLLADKMPSKEEIHDYFMEYLKEEGIDTLYQYSLLVKEDNLAYEQVLIFRNQYNWVYYNTEQLKTDIPAFLKSVTSTPEPETEIDPKSVYILILENIFTDYPSTEWETYHAMAAELTGYFEKGSNEYINVLGIKSYLEFLIMNDNLLKETLPLYLSYLDNDSDLYTSMLWQYGALQNRNGNTKEALKIFREGWEKTAQTHFLESLISSYSYNQNYKKVLEYENTILHHDVKPLYYYLGEAYLKTDKEKAKKYFDIYVSLFEYNTLGELYIETENYTSYVFYSKLMTLGDFYSTESCKYYALAEKTLKGLNHDSFYEEELIAISDPTLRKTLIKKHEKNNKETEKQLAIVHKKQQKSGCNN